MNGPIAFADKYPQDVNDKCSQNVKDSLFLDGSMRLHSVFEGCYALRLLLELYNKY